MRNMVICVLIAFICATRVFGSSITIDGILNESIYKKVEPLKSDISLLYLVPMADGVYIGADVADDNINVPDPQQFWNSSCVEVWFDWANDDSPVFDENDQQFWFCPVKGNGNKGYMGQWHRANDCVKETMYDYANQSDKMDMAFVINQGKGYTIEARIGKEAMKGYTSKGKIGFTYSADKDGVKNEWEKAQLGGIFYEQPNTWPDLVITEVLAVKSVGKLTIVWGRIKM